jgi:hypothetical protein
MPFTIHSKLHEFGAENQFPELKPAHFDFITIKFTV